MGYPPLNRYKSAREICDKAVAMMKPGDPLAMFNCFGDPYLFYTNNSHIQVMRRLDELQQFLHSPERVFLFIQEKDFKSLSKSLEMPVFVLEKDSVGHRDILLFLIRTSSSAFCCRRVAQASSLLFLMK